MSMTLKKEVLLKYKKDCDVFIETGTGTGSTIKLALECGFKKIYTLDISRMYEKSCNDIYTKEIQSKIVDIRYGDTIDILPEILKEVKNEKTLFWLDAHYDDSTKPIGKLECPILVELKLIKNNNMLHIPTILIDDVRLFGDQTFWGKTVNIRDVIKNVKRIDPHYFFGFEDGWSCCDILVAFK